MVKRKKRLSALQMQRDLRCAYKTAYKTAWYLNHRKTMALVEKANESKLEGTVGADESYMGGKYF